MEILECDRCRRRTLHRKVGDMKSVFSWKSEGIEMWECMVCDLWEYWFQEKIEEVGNGG